MSWKDFLEDGDWPLFKVFVCCNIYRATECIMSGIPCLLPNQFFLIDQNPKHFQDRHRRMELI